MLDRGPHGNAKEQWRLADRLAAVEVDGVAGGIEEGDVELRRHIGHMGDLVRRRRMGEQLSRAGVTERFGGDPAHALHETTRHLPQIDRRIDRSAQIHEDVGARHLHVARVAVDEHFGHGTAAGVIAERVPLAGLPVEVDIRRREEAPFAEIDALFMSQPHEFLEAEADIRIAGIKDISALESNMSD